MMKALSRGKQMMNSLEQVPKVLASSIHMSTPAQGSLTIPERLLHVPDAEDPGFFESVEYFFHKACVMAEDTLVDENMRSIRTSRDEKLKKAHGILRIIEPCAHVIEINFPLLRDNGEYEMIQGFRA